MKQIMIELFIILFIAVIAGLLFVAAMDHLRYGYIDSLFM